VLWPIGEFVQMRIITAMIPAEMNRFGMI